MITRYHRPARSKVALKELIELDFSEIFNTAKEQRRKTKVFLQVIEKRGFLLKGRNST